MNDELSYQISNALKGFGNVVSVKTARDHEGRPYSFVQFQEVESALKVLNRKISITIGGRRVRIEKAKCLRKLQVSISLLSPFTIQVSCDFLQVIFLIIS
jgi:RNA recognition motif. (a.k.a. RRM, RBD, or RNP domain)